MSEQVVQHEKWSSRRGFILATIGAAVGLGNLWRFPYLAGENGGGAFVLVYLAFVFLIGLPIMIGEMTMGRMGRGSAIATMAYFIRERGKHPFWKVIGGFSLLIPFVGLSYYSVVAAWTLDYLGLAVSGALSGLTGADPAVLFEARAAAPVSQFLLHAEVIGITAVVVGRGVQKGIEWAASFMMPALFLMLLLLVLYCFLTADFAAALEFLFRPNFADLTTHSVLAALGQAFFSLAIGVGMLITYAAYVPDDVSLPFSAGGVCVRDTFVAVLAGLAIFPIVFAVGLEAGEGPGLIFISLPVAFASMPGGRIIGGLFFLLMFFAAFTTTVGMLEPVVSWAQEHKGMSRRRAALLVALGTWALGISSVLSCGAWKDVYPLGFLDIAAGKTFFDLLDFLIANLLLPLNGLLIALFVG